MLYKTMWAVRNRRSGELSTDISRVHHSIQPVLFETKAAAKRAVLKTGRIICVMLVELCQMCRSPIDSARLGYPHNLCWPCRNKKRFSHSKKKEKKS